MYLQLFFRIIASQNFFMSKFTVFLMVVLLLIVGIIVYNKVLYPKEQAPTGPTGGPPQEMPVAGFLVQAKSLENGVTASGTLLSNEEVELHAEVSGKITLLNLSEGTAVTKGTLLVKLYDADLQAQFKKLLLQRETAEKTEQRLKQLLSVNGIGQQEYDNALIQLNNIKADIELIQANISKTEIRAPFNGIVGLRNVSEGAYITPATSVATLQQINPLKIDFTIPEKYSSALRKGDIVKFTTDGSNEPHTGKIYATEPRIDEATRSIKIRALVQNHTAELLPGTFAKVDVGLKSIDNALMIPTQCIIPEARNKKVIVVNGGKADFRIVQTGVRSQSQIQITDGISEGDTIIASALMSVKPGMGLKVIKLIE